jgi:predicted RNase H-like HicB family nuclease
MPKAKTTKAKRTTTVRGTQYEYTVVFEPAEEGGYVVTVPALPGLHTEGDTFEEAQTMAADAIRCYIEGCILDGEEVPVEHGYAITQRIPVQLSPAKA